MQFILFLSSLIVISSAQEYLNAAKVSWDKAINGCTVPEIGRLRSSNDSRDENGFYAWTATHEWSSGWAFFQGCIDINIQREDKQRLSDHFGNINLSFIADRDDVFQCAFHCTNLNYFVYYHCELHYKSFVVVDNIGHPMKWANAVNYCTNLNSKLSKTVGNVSLDVWSRYIRYQILLPDNNNERRKCVATCFLFICIGDINTIFNISTNVTDISTTQIPSNSSEKIDIDVIVKVNIVLLMLSIVMIVLFSVRVCCCKKKADPK
ncbi:unnamed protein product [Mytilus edulis]|uniref:Uncharacterized protein n=1 Tax=Mytilus edulis TaxID=6550 RepID=A0A8S3S2A3_MYTED|nr:unnamed protein product [Mytilus edulis]